MKILGVHYWDTRPRTIAPYWSLNTPLVRNTFEVIGRNLPNGWALNHHIVLHEIEEVPGVRELAEEWGELHIHNPPRTTRHFFNNVALSCYDILEEHINASDLVFGMSQDRLLINYYDTNLLVLMYGMMQGHYSGLAHHRRAAPYDYVSHTIPARPQWHRWNHNAGSGVGLWRSHRLPIIREAHAQSEQAGEVYLHRTLGEHCLYMKLNPWVYMGDYRMGHLTSTRVEFLMGLTRDQRRMARLVATVESQWCASLHPFWEEVE